jgi:hypothetical protein
MKDNFTCTSYYYMNSDEAYPITYMTPVTFMG